MNNQTEDKTQKTLCLIRSNNDIRDAIFKRITENSMTLRDVCEDAEHYDYSINLSQLSRYLKDGDKIQYSGTLSQKSIMWLAMRYGIDVSIEVKLKPYIKANCIKNIKTNYGN